MQSKLSNLVDSLSGIFNKDAKNVWKENKLGQNVNLSDLEIID